MTSQASLGYAGDVDAESAYRDLESDAAAQLVDVRTREEWSFVGIPDLAGLAKQPLLIDWQSWPEMQVQQDFLVRLREGLAERGIPSDAPLYFLCRSGVRSAAAASAAAASGFGPSFNISGGFEGPPDDQRHRGSTDGWKARGLPWLQN